MKFPDTLEAVAAPLPLANIDTDKIVPSRFLKTISRSGLKDALFNSLRRHPDGTDNAEFILNRSPWTTAQILITLGNFGCGSSREHAPWALLDFGIRCIIAPSFADIFYNNCLKNGILPILQPIVSVQTMLETCSCAETAVMIVDLVHQSIRCGDGIVARFDIHSGHKKDLLEGNDDISKSLRRLAEIDSYEKSVLIDRPWMPDIRLG